MQAVKTVLGVALLAALVPVASAQTFPGKSMRMVVPTAPAGSADLLARILAEHLSKRFGQTMIVDNRPGAGQTIGSDHVAKSAPDGNTLLTVTVSYTTSAAIYSRLPYDPLTDLVGVAMIGDGPMILTVHPSLPARNVKELIALARAKPGTLDFGSAGAGTIPHLAMELLAGMAKVDIVHVPYKGIAPAVTATVAGEIPALIVSTPSGGPMIKAGRLRALAVTTLKRASFLPELPTMSEAGVPGYDVSTWWGVLAPAKTPPAIVNRLNEEIRKILALDEVKAVVIKNGAEPVLDMPAAKFDAMLKAEIAKWRRIVKERKIETQ
jgi:tripartite-type tricarboxylate transporter receptor subunit TctC